jgi:geranylgeranyl pyrophosphate synthase
MVELHENRKGGERVIETTSEREPSPLFESCLPGAFEPALTAHLKTVRDSQGKRLRSRLSRLGFGLAHDDPSNLQLQDDFDAAGGHALTDLIEDIHAGSLVIDDIQDGSQSRRNSVPLYRQIGIPLAINTGNYLYFHALDRIPKLKLQPERELWLWRTANRVLREGHEGQALDLSHDFRLGPDSIVEKAALYDLIITRKTGALTGFAFASGGLLNPASTTEQLCVLFQLGSVFGDLLQRYDDILNLNLPIEHPKLFEDLRLGRPSLVWIMAGLKGENCEKELSQLCQLQAPPSATQAWVARWNLIEEGLAMVDRRSQSLRELMREVPLAAGGRAWGISEMDRILFDLRRAAASPGIAQAELTKGLNDVSICKV